MSAGSRPAPKAEASSGPASARAWYALSLFLLANILINVDKAIFSVLAEPIKRQFDVSDSAIGLLSGLSFTVVFAVAGLPLGRWADRGPRRAILAVSLALFSGFTAAGCLARSYLQLVLLRLGVAVGEAGGAPAMVSSIMDLFPPGRRATAMGVFYLGVPLGLFCCYFFLTALTQRFGWRVALGAVGIPGVLLALVIRGTLAEPPRAWGAASGPAIGFVQAFATVWAAPVARHLIAAATVTAVINAGLLLWAVSEMVRSHGFSLAGAGAVMAFSLGGMGALGTGACGWLADRLAAKDARWRCWLCALTLCAAAPFAIGFLFSPTRSLVTLCMLGWGASSVSIFGAVVATLQAEVPPHVRGAAMATYLFGTSLVGISLGTLVAGALSDALTSVAGPDALRDGMLLLTGLYPWAIFHLMQGARLMRRDLAAAPGRPSLLSTP